MRPVQPPSPLEERSFNFLKELETGVRNDGMHGAALADNAHIQELLGEAKQGNAHAIEFLTNIAARPDEFGKRVREQLTALYAAPDLRDDIRTDIRACAFGLCELAINAATRKAPNAPDTPTNLPAPLAYLGGQYAHESGALETEKAIEKHLVDQITNQHYVVEGSDKLLSSGRFVSDDELLAATRGLHHLQVHDNALILRDDVETFGDGIDQILNDLEPGQTRAALITDDNHWVTATIHWPEYNGGDEPTVVPKPITQCVVFDANATSTSTEGLGYQVQQKLTGLLGYPPVLVANPMQQSVPNACGPLNMNLLRSIDQQLESQALSGSNATFDLAHTVNQHVQHWAQLSESQQKAQVSIERAKLLEAWAQGQEDAALGSPMAWDEASVGRSIQLKGAGLELRDLPADLQSFLKTWDDEALMGIAYNALIRSKEHEAQNQQDKQNVKHDATLLDPNLTLYNWAQPAKA